MTKNAQTSADVSNAAALSPVIRSKVTGAAQKMNATMIIHPGGEAQLSHRFLFSYKPEGLVELASWVPTGRTISSVALNFLSADDSCRCHLLTGPAGKQRTTVLSERKGTTVAHSDFCRINSPWIQQSTLRTQVMTTKQE